MSGIKFFNVVLDDDTHIIIHVGLFFYVVLISFTVSHGRC